jgi:hypothetical protein
MALNVYSATAKRIGRCWARTISHGRSRSLRNTKSGDLLDGSIQQVSQRQKGLPGFRHQRIVTCTIRCAD